MDSEQIANADSELFGMLPAAIYTCDLQGRITFFNAAAATLWGRKPELDGDRWSGALRTMRMDGSPLPLDESPAAVVLNGIIPHSETFVIERPDGSHCYTLHSVRPLHDKRGRISGALVMLIDVTEQHHSAMAQLETEQQLAQIVNLLPAAVYCCDAAGRLTAYNQRAVEAWGYEPPLRSDSVRFCGFTTIHIGRKSMAPDECPMADAVREGLSFNEAESLVDRPDGRQLRIRANIQPLRDAHGNLAGAINVFHDVTRRDRLENDARRLAAIVTSSQDAIMAIDLDGSITSWNRGAEVLFGYSQDEILGQHVGILRPSQDDAEPPVAEQIRNGPKFYEAVRQAKDGTLLDVSATVSPVLDEQGRVCGISKIIRDIGHLRQIEAKLREEARRKSEFLATLSHELRNPLAPLRNGMEILQQTKGMPPQTMPIVQMMQRQLHQMVHLINDLLDFSRINQGKLRLQKAIVPIAEAVQSAVETCQPLIDEQKHRFTVELPDRPLKVEADVDRLSQVFANLISNAAKYTPSGGRLRLTVTERDGEVAIAMSDNGAGIPPDQLVEIFELFTQVDPGLQAAQTGLGIGLTLVRKLVEMHGGRIVAYSDGPGRGSTFTVHLPLVAMTQPVSGRSNPVGFAPTESARQRVLVVDDNKDAATTLATILDMFGHEVITAHDGEQAVKSALEIKPDLILMDIGMPKLDGYQACRQIRRCLPQYPLTIVALTGWGQEDDRQQSEQAGFDYHLVKPVEISALSEIIATHRKKTQPRFGAS